MQELLLALAGGARRQQPAIDPTLLLLALAGAQQQRAPGGHGPKHRERERLRGLTLREFCRDWYLPGKNHPAEGSTGDLSRWALNRLRDCCGRELLLREATPDAIDRFRSYLVGQVQSKQFRPATANKHLRQLRAVVNYAARKRLIRRLPPLDFLDEQLAEITAWSPEQLEQIFARAGLLTGRVEDVPAGIWWRAWTGTITRIGCRISAMMAAQREDYSRGALLLRAEHQKQRQNQRIQLPPRSAAAVEDLLGAHGGALIWPWPHDRAPAGKRRNWKTLRRHFTARILKPCGLTLPKGVCTRQARRTVITLVDQAGGDAQRLAGHSSARVTAGYKDRKRMPVCREALMLPEASKQMELF